MPDSTATTGEDWALRLEIATRAASIGVWDWNLQTGQMVYSPRAREICGFSADEPISYEQVRDITHPDDYPTTSAMAKRAVDPAVKERGIFRYRIIRADTGEVRFVVAHGEAHFETRDGVEVATRYTGTIQDVTEQKAAEDALAESEARLRLALEAADMAVWELDLETDTIVSSPELNRLMGFSADAQPSIAEYRDRYAPGERERIAADGAEALARGETKFQAEFRTLWPNGTSRWLRLRCQFAPHDQRKRVLGVLYDITDQKETEERRLTMAHELNHRVKNTLSIVQTLANQTFRPGKDIKEALNTFGGRLRALGEANDVMFHDADFSTSLREVVAKSTAPYRQAGNDPFRLDGQDLMISGRLATSLSMAFHELATNAAKYGSLSVPEGFVELGWKAQEEQLHFVWREVGGPEVVQPKKLGFGTRLIETGLFQAAGDKVAIEYLPQGLVCELKVRMREGG